MPMIIFAFCDLNAKSNVMYTKNYKTSLKEIRDDLNKWKDLILVSCTWILVLR